MRRSLVAVSSLAFLLAACRGDSTSNGSKTDATAGEVAGREPASDVSAPVDAVGGACSVSVGGDLSLDFAGPGGPRAVGSDYWLAPEDLVRALKTLSPDEDPTVESVTDRLASGGEPMIYILLLNCTHDDDNTISLYPGNGSTYADVPFGPASYPIDVGDAPGGDTAGAFGALITVDALSFTVTAPGGSIDITSWDRSGIAGTFEFAASEPEILADGTPKQITVSGTFDFACPSTSGCH